MFAVLASALILCVSAKAAPLWAHPVSYQETPEDPLWVPRELIAFARVRVALGAGERGKAEALSRVLIWPEELGGLGIQYSNDRTRTVNEVWLERKANCLSMTFVYVMLARHLQINAMFGESFEAVNWSRVGDVIRLEKHMVAVIQRHPAEDLVADFLPQTRARYGNYFVDLITNARARSLFYSNSAVEALIDNDKETAIDNITKALEADPTSSQAWNIKGVIEKSSGNTTSAVRSYKTAIRNNPNNVVAIGNLAALYVVEGLYEEAARLRAIENGLRKRDPYYFAFLASEAMGKDDLAKAQKLIQRAIKIHPKDADFYVTLSYIYQAQNKLTQAIDTLNKARNHVASDKTEKIDSLISEYRALLSSK
ncbi:MAG: tetratricopeptide repeat protein [Holophagales bacterium]|jgi:Flp pilus assembly protein TadD|nr:tetratricopeptide repeat protein [Holophagales bacterium]